MICTTDRHAYVSLGGTYRLRISLRHDESGTPTWVALTRGYGEGEAFTSDFTDVFTIPVSRIEDVIAAVTELVEP